MKTPLSVNPWLQIWVKPRATIRKIVNYNPNFRLFILSAIYGFISLLSSPQYIALNTLPALYLSILVMVILSPIWGYIIFNVATFFIYFTGKWLKGKAKFKEARCAIAWANAPMIVNVFLWILLLLVFREDVLRDIPATIILSKAQRVFLFLTFICQLVISIWIIVLYINTLAEVQKFSIGKAILNILIALALVAVVFFAIILIYSLVMRGLHLR